MYQTDKSARSGDDQLTAIKTDEKTDAAINDWRDVIKDYVDSLKKSDHPLASKPRGKRPYAKQRLAAILIRIGRKRAMEGGYEISSSETPEDREKSFTINLMIRPSKEFWKTLKREALERGGTAEELANLYLRHGLDMVDKNDLSDFLPYMIADSA